MMAHGNKYEQWKAQKNREKFCKDTGHRLRHLAEQYENNPNFPDFAVARGEALEMIKQYGDEPKIINADGSFFWTPIFRAVSYKNYEVTHALMRAPSFDPNKRNIWGQSILMATLDDVYPDHELIQFLLNHPKTDVTIKTHESEFFHRQPRLLLRERGATALFYATKRHDHYQYIPAILDKSGPEVNDDVTYEHAQATCFCDGAYEIKWPLTNLVEKIDSWPQEQRAMLLDCVRRIANAELDPKRKHPEGHPRDHALLIAAKAGDKDVVEILLAAGANKELKDYADRTAEMIARFGGHPEVADIIKNHAAVVSVTIAALR